MPNQEHLDILKQGVDTWNEWRQDNPHIRPNLSGANLYSMSLVYAQLSNTDLTNADLHGKDLTDADLSGADLRDATLVSAEPIRTLLTNADLRGTVLQGAHFRQSGLHRANLGGAILSDTTFSNVDLSATFGLATVKHHGPSTIGLDTIYLSKGKIPEVFLRGCGLPDDFIKYSRSLIKNPAAYYSCFISHSSRDKDFADRLYIDLQARGIRCWYAPQHLRIGDKFRTRIEESIRRYDKLLLIFSENSIQSAWVEEEVETALERERHRKRSFVLFPIRLDNAIMETEEAWVVNLRRTRHFGDFSQWRDHANYKKAFDQLLRDLNRSNQAA